MTELIASNEQISDNAEINALITNITSRQDDNSVLYFQFPQYRDYEGEYFSPSILYLNKNAGIKCLFTETAGDDDYISKYLSLIFSRLIKSRILKNGPMSLNIPINAAYMGEEQITDEAGAVIIHSVDDAISFLTHDEGANLSDDQYNELRSILEGTKALGRPKQRIITDPGTHLAAKALAKVEAEIARFDVAQRQAALQIISGPQRIRGLAGSGKTVILALKAAHFHLNNPNKRVLITYYTKALGEFLRNLVGRFYRHFAEEDPDWSVIDIQHAWGGASVKGVYSAAADRASHRRLTLGDVPNNEKNKFDYVCRDLLEKSEIDPYYDFVLIDEGQDFPPSFYQLAYCLTKSHKGQRSIVWAYDELQNIFDVGIRSAEDLFGTEADGTPRVSLTRAAEKLTASLQNDIVLSKCYRNQRDVLIAAHALGFGIYGPRILQMLEDKEHWEDVGYNVNGTYRVHRPVDIVRPDENSPVNLEIDDTLRLIDTYLAKNMQDEVEYVSSQIKEFMNSGITPDDIMVITLDDRYGKKYFQEITKELAEANIKTHNLLIDSRANPPFRIDDSITLTTIHRAKGNESAVIFCCGVDAINRDSRVGRNRLFTAFTRTKGWLRVTGIGENAQSIIEEIGSAFENTPHLRFVLPSKDEIETIQRDLSERDKKVIEIKKLMIEKFRALGLSDEEIETHVNEIHDVDI